MTDLLDLVWKNRSFRLSRRKAGCGRSYFPISSGRYSFQLLPVLDIQRGSWFLLLLFIVIGLTILLSRWVIKKKLSAQQERIRKKLAQDFHDELGSQLSIIGMYSELAKIQLKNGGEEVADHLDKIESTAAGLFKAVKDLLWTLDPEKDTLDSFLAKLEEAARELLQPAQINFFLHKTYQNGKQQLTMDEKRHLLLLLKEALNNAYKHADCANIHIDLRVANQMLDLTLSDDGKGFDTTKNYRGEGLQNMRSRANELAGLLDIRSDRNGTTIQLSCPLKYKNW